ncbi:phosphodiesterase [Salinadaptatus halalkaliphilus]|uniref:Phosphodiesterase n=1 Tax=Salinadaptatus halalkaliphilus TaxID=2419781 RepID=A0A4S3TR35_9EURY|nr:alkaline phosphatase family protein [Salinadaptatus halalkaliphilus]THE65028.1 phosphodiesterase [Salinadaptatus halalkaliphilus]
MTIDATDTDRALVLGIDGVPWDRIHDWIVEGKLPNFGRLLEQGVAAPLESTTPPTTPTAWPSIATGVWPDKHGIYGFQRVESDYTQEMNTSVNLERSPLWEHLSPAIVGNVPMTYPASDIDGTMVSGMIAPSLNDRFASPSSLVDEIDEHVPEYRIGLNWYDYADDETRFTDDLASLVDSRRALMDHLMEIDDWRLFFFVYTAPDRLQHLIWDDDVILEHYEQLDAILGDVLDYVTEHEANLFVVSDHGFGPISKFVNLNTVLSEAGYLTPKAESTARNSLSQLGVTKSNVLGMVKRMGVDDKRVVQALPKRLVDGIAEQVPGEHGLYDVDFAETVAFTHGPGYVYINDTDRFARGAVSPAEIPSLKRELHDLFADVTDPETGETALSVHDGDDVFPTDDESPDLVIVGEDGYEEKTSLGDDVFESAGSKAASHRSQGVFFAYGPGIDARGTVEELEVVDIAPTLLHSVGEPIPDDIDGTVRTDLLASEAAPTVQAAGEERSSARPDDAVDDDFGDVEDRLRGLGYMD